MSNEMCAACGAELQPDGWEAYCPVCQSPEARRTRYEAQFRSPVERAVFEAAGPYGNSVLSVLRKAGMLPPGRRFNSTKIVEY